MVGVGRVDLHETGIRLSPMAGDELMSRSLRTPRAAALAGVLFAVLLTATLALIGLATPSDAGEVGACLKDPNRRVMVDPGKEHDEVREARLKADALREAAQPFLTDPFLAQANRADGPIGERWFVPSLLSEAPARIRRVMTLLETTPYAEGEADTVTRGTPDYRLRGAVLDGTT